MTRSAGYGPCALFHSHCWSGGHTGCYATWSVLLEHGSSGSIQDPGQKPERMGWHWVRQSPGTHLLEQSALGAGEPGEWLCHYREKGYQRPLPQQLESKMVTPHHLCVHHYLNYLQYVVALKTDLQTLRGGTWGVHSRWSAMISRCVCVCVCGHMGKALERRLDKVKQTGGLAMPGTTVY